MRLVRNSILIKGIIIFLCFVMIQSGIELHALEADHSEELNQLVKKYNDKEYDEVITKLEQLLNEVGEDQGQIRGKFFLLLGASHEKKGNKDKAIENYLLGDILLGKSELEGIDLKSLKIFNNTIYGKVVNGQRVYEKVGKRKRKKKFPYFALLGVAALVAAIVLLSKKKPAEDNEYLKELNAKELFSELEWIEIPAGEFIMGDSTGAGDPDETPAHVVYLDSYKISKYEITFAQFNKYLIVDPNFNIPLDEKLHRHPITNRSYTVVTDFCLWLRQYTNNSVYLPTEAQWEKAARGTDERIYPWGNNNPDCSITNYNNCIGETSVVGSNPNDRSFYGVMDMGGNVSEIVSDFYSRQYYSVSPYSNPIGPLSGLYYKVIRGGNYNSLDTRTTNREYMSRTTSNFHTGFRVVWLD